MRALSFRSDGDGIKADPHQSSFWTKAVGADPRGVDFRSLALASPRKSSVPCPVQVQRLEALDEQRLLYRLLKPRPDGSTALTLTPLELIQRLVALIPPLRVYRHRYHGVLTSNARLLSAVTAPVFERQQTVFSGRSGATS